MVPFDLNAKQLKPNYIGHDLVRLADAFDNLKISKGKFETTAAYQGRIDALGKKTVYGYLKVGSTFGCVLPRTLSYNADNQRLNAVFTATDIMLESDRTSYDIPSLGVDDGLTYLALPGNREVNLKAGSYIGSNAFGAKTRVERYTMLRYLLLLRNPSDWGLNMTNRSRPSYLPEVAGNTVKLGATVPPPEAKKVMPRLQVLAIFSTAHPFVRTIKSFHTATMDEPYEENGRTVYLGADVKAFWLYDSATGKVYAKLTPDPEPTEAPEKDGG